MELATLQATIENAWEKRDTVNAGTTGTVREAVDAALAALDAGKARVAEKGAGGWTVNQWLKKAVLLSFRLNDSAPMPGGPGGSTWYDKVPSKFEGWGDNAFRAAGFRAVPNCVVRRSAFIAPGVVLMPSFVNVGRTATSPAAPASAACSSPCRRIPCASRTTASSARAARSPRA